MGAGLKPDLFLNELCSKDVLEMGGTSDLFSIVRVSEKQKEVAFLLIFPGPERWCLESWAPRWGRNLTDGLEVTLMRTYIWID